MNHKRYRTKRIEVFESEKDLKEYHKFRVACSKVTGKEFVHKNSIHSLKSIIEKLSKSNVSHYIVWDEEKEKGYFYLKLIKCKKEYGKKRVIKLSHHIIGGLSNIEILLAIQQVIKDKADYLILSCRGDENTFIEKELNSLITEEKEHYRLDVSTFDEEKIRNWYLFGETNFKHFKLEFHTEITSSIIKEYSDLYTDILKDIEGLSLYFNWDIPSVKGIKEREEGYKKKNHCFFHYLIFDESRKLIGMTFVEFDKKSPQKVIQNMTGVLKEYRRKGLSKWLKASMYLKLKKEIRDLEVLETAVHRKNIRMKNLNIQMGYRKVEVIKEHRININELRNFE